MTEFSKNFRQNEFMRVIVLLSLFVLCSPRSGAVTEPGSESWKVQRLNARYEDFFRRERDGVSWDKSRQAGAAAVTTERKRWEKNMEQAREDYIKHKKAAPDKTAAEKAWLAEQQQRSEEQEIARRRYVQVENRLTDLKKKAKNISGNREYHLEEFEP
jgi:hypothetical protein